MEMGKYAPDLWQKQFKVKIIWFVSISAACIMHNTKHSSLSFPHNKAKEKRRRTWASRLRSRLTKKGERQNGEGMRGGRRVEKIKDFEVFGASAALFVQFICANRSSLSLACNYFFRLLPCCVFFFLQEPFIFVSFLMRSGKVLSRFRLSFVSCK